MHWTPFSRTQRRTRLSGRERTRGALKNWLTWNGSSRRRTRSGAGRGCCRRRRWRFVHRAGPGLGHDHSRQRRDRSSWLGRRRGLHLRNVSLCRRLRRRNTTDRGGRSRNPGHDCDRRRWRICNRWTCSRWSRGERSYRNFRWNHDHRWRTVSGSYRSRGDNPRRRRGSMYVTRGLGRHYLRSRRQHWRRWSFRAGFDRWRSGGWPNRWAGRGMFGCFLLLRDGAQHIAGPRNMREVDLGLDFFFAVSGPRGRLRRPARCFGAPAEMLPYQFRFKIL